ncbi:MAG TPA: metallophosphoesterase family protein, partial [Candidatus Latescibacteria bacterium]|nr:metallophosphoesterase family protein [Candidatus Latescibacterota bacterium]
ELIAPVHAIRGNTDPFDLPFPEVLDTSHKGIRFHVRHVVPTSGRSLEFFTMRTDAHVVLFGHTHVPFLEKVRGTLFLNPGAISRSRVPAETAASSPCGAGKSLRRCTTLSFTNFQCD